MPVPPVEAEGHAPHPRFHQTACHEELFRAFGSTVVPAFHGPTPVAGADFGVFLLQIQGFGQPARREHAHGLLLKGIHGGDHPRGINIAAHVIKTGQEGTPVLEPVQRNIV